jgi:hypothetical protein
MGMGLAKVACACTEPAIFWFLSQCPVDRSYRYFVKLELLTLNFRSGLAPSDNGQNLRR